MLQNAYFLAKIGVDTAENEQHFAEILPTPLSDVSASTCRPEDQVDTDERAMAHIEDVGHEVRIFLGQI